MLSFILRMFISHYQSPHSAHVVLQRPVIFETYIGLPRQLALILGGVNSTVYAMSSFASYLMIERLGRRKMFLWGTAGQAGSMVNFATACCCPPTLMYSH